VTYVPQQCIFCKSTSAAFTAVEHIVPESLGNTEHILPRGVVCDPCNNYFANKIEGPILASDFFRQARHRNGIPNKRKRIPIQEAIAFPHAMLLEIGVDRDGTKYICPADETQNEDFKHIIEQRQPFLAVFPVADAPDNKLFARFLLMMGIEALAMRMLSVENGIKVDHVENTTLDEARQFVRFGCGPNVWPFHETRIYDEGQLFYDWAEPYDIPHEYTLLYTDDQEIYFVIALFGIQYTINLGGPEIDGFQRWLNSHNNESPLYPKGK
jgi:hypothetical protein